MKGSNKGNTQPTGASFNPHPPRRAGESYSPHADMGAVLLRFNPHPPRRAGERPSTTSSPIALRFQSAPAPEGG